MAPSRRRGASKGAASAAALKKWKVGDLVLAKVKGFPAWPATVSEPQKWGYPADLKKVVVYFFGTQQIAFCTPTEIEEFTEEKKVSLLGKRHGKGADFVRAVKEISECFDKLKQEQVNSANGTEETNITNEYNSEESMTKCVKNEHPVLDPLSVEAADNLKSLTEAAVAAAAEDALLEKERHKEIPSNSSTGRKRDIAQSRNSGSKGSRSDPRLKRLRTDSGRGQNIIPSINTIKSSKQSGNCVLQEKSLRRSGRFTRSSDHPGWQGADSLASVSNNSTEESDSETISVDSDTLSVNDGSTIVLGSKPTALGLSSENNMLETMVSGSINLETKNIFKKSGISNPKGDNDKTVEVSNIEVLPLDVEVLKYECVSPSSSEKLAQRNAKDESDEHLPFAKRARVRLGRASPAVKEEVSLEHKEENMLEVPENPSVLCSEPLSCKVDVPSDQECSPVKENLVNSPCVSPARNLQFPEAKKNFVDGEAALPPSKRLHRALEAMSANAVEDFQVASNLKSAVEVVSKDCCPSSVSSELHVAVEELRPGGSEDLSNRDSLSAVSKLCILSNMDSLGSSSKNVASVSECGNSGCMDSTSTELCKNIEPAEEHNDSKSSECIKMPASVGVPTKTSPENHVKPESPNVCQKSDHLACDAPDSTLHLTDGRKIECSELNGALRVSEISSEKNSEFVIATEVGSPDVGKSNWLFSTNDAVGGTHKMKQLSEAEKNSNHKMCDLLEEIKSASLGQNTMLISSPPKALGSSQDRCTVQSKYFSRGQMDDQTVSVTLSSSSLTDGPSSVARASPPSSSVCNIPASDNTNHIYENNGSCSPDVHLHLEKAKLVVKSSSKWESLSSFEAIIKSLTRTKESIGRATRIAINCAKFGLATKVVEMLVHSLEGESSLRKKVDLFFLVDSITQCSRGMKGDAGIYPSAIQALLPRLLLAAAPPGSSSYENHKQCLKVLRVWQERRILPEPIIRHHIQQLDVLCGSYPSVSSRRPLRNERAFDDPIRQMEGMQVDEYGSNSSIQLAGFCMPPMLSGNNGGSESDGESFEAVTPEHNNIENCDGESTLTQPVQKRSHILEDVDGELEMEDVAPSSEVEGSDIIGTDHHMPMPHRQFDNQYGAQYPTQTPNDVPLTSAPLSGSLPPPPPPPPLPPPPPPPPPPHHPPSDFPPTVLSVSNGHDSKSYLSSQNLNSNIQESVANQAVLPSVKSTSVDAGCHPGRDNNFGAQLPRQMADSNNGCTYNDRPNPVIHSQASNSIQQGFHLRPPQPAPTNQFSYVQEPRIQPWADAPPPPHPNGFRTCNAENGNFYRDHDRNNFIPHDNVGDCWRPPFPAISGPCYRDGPRMVHPPVYNGPPRDPTFSNNRWNFPPPPMNNGHYNPYGPTPDGPIPVANRGPNFWRPR